jgi:hypothetical protein
MSRSKNGLINDFIDCIKSGEIHEPFNANDLRRFVERNGWNYSDNFINVALPNHTADNHSMSYKKVFVALGDGQYKLR